MKEKERILRLGERSFLWTVLLGLPLILFDGYFDITAAKTLWFIAAALGYLLFRLVMGLQFGFALRCLSAGEWCALALGVIVLLSSLMSGFFGDSFLGMLGRWQGAGMLWIYILLTFALCRSSIRPEDVGTPLLLGLTLTAVLAVLQHLGWDVLGLERALSARDRGRFISTLGNINMAAAYFSLMLPCVLCLLLLAEGWRKRLALGSAALVGLWAAMACRSESALLGVGAAVVLMPLALSSQPKALRRWPLLLPGMMLAGEIYRLLSSLFGKQLSALTSLLLSPIPALLIAFIGILLWLWLRKKEDAALPGALRGYSLLLLGVLVLAAAFLSAVNTLWRELPLGSLDPWLRFSDAWGTDRVKVWGHCLGFYRDFGPLEKLFGGGCGILPRLDVHKRIFDDAVLDTAHCEYLQILLNWGCLGLAAYVGWICLSVANGLHRGSVISACLTCGLLGYSVQALVNIAQAPGICFFFVLLPLAAAEIREE